VLVLLDGKEIHRVNVGGEQDYKDIDQNLEAGVYHVNSRLRDIRFHATAGQHKVAVTFLRRSYAESDERVRPNVLDGGQQRVNAVHAMQIKGPLKITGMSMTPSRAKIFICTPANAAEEMPCAQRIIANLGQHAFRRPLTDADMQPLLAFYQKGRQAGTFDTGIRDALSAILASPNFLFRMEEAGDSVRTLSDLDSPRACHSSSGAACPTRNCWIWRPGTNCRAGSAQGPGAPDARRSARPHTDHRFRLPVAEHREDGHDFPAQAQFGYAAGAYDPRPLFKKELTLFIDGIFRSDRSVVELLTDDHTYVNEQLALLYGMEDVKGGEFRRVTLTDPDRFGLLGKARF